MAFSLSHVQSKVGFKPRKHMNIWGLNVLLVYHADKKTALIITKLVSLTFIEYIRFFQSYKDQNNVISETIV